MKPWWNTATHPGRWLVLQANISGFCFKCEDKTNVGEEVKHMKLSLWWECTTTLKNGLTIFIKVNPAFKF